MELTTSDKLKIIRGYQENSHATVPVITLAEALGLEVFYFDGWPSDQVSGMIVKDEETKSGYTIYVNAKHHSNRQRFSIAHEIAHFVLHKDQIGDKITDDALYRSGLTNKTERQANNLAADILMPWKQLSKAMNQLTKEGVYSSEKVITTLAKSFRVSKSAMSIRLNVPY